MSDAKEVERMCKGAVIWQDRESDAWYIKCTVEPLNNGHIGADHFVHYREVVLFQR